MQFRLLGCCGSRMPGNGPTSVLLGNAVLFDCGSVASTLSLDEQALIEDVFLTHAHFDHVAELPFLLENRAQQGGRPLTVRGVSEALDAVKSHVLNGVMYPDFSRIPQSSPVLAYAPLSAETRVDVRDASITSVPLEHSGGSLAYIVDVGEQRVVIAGDTGPTDQLWRTLRLARRPIAALLIEASFPDRLRDLALATGHLTPALLRAELEKLGNLPVNVYVQHIKPATREETLRDLSAMKVRIAKPGMTIDPRSAS